MKQWLRRIRGAVVVGGAIFSVVLGIAEGRRRFDELSLTRR
jgi:hypothetical protein